MEQDNSSTLKAFRETTMELDNLYYIFAKSCGLSESEYWSLLLIHEGVVTQSEISEQLFLSRQTLNSSFKQLVKKGLIVLETNEKNQRTKRAVLTEKGRDVVEKQVVNMHRTEELAWEKLTEDEQSALVRLTRKFTDAVVKRLRTIGQFKMKSSEDMRPQL